MGSPTRAALLTKIANTIFKPEGEMVSFLTRAERWDMHEIAFNLPSSVTGISERDSVNLRGTFARRVNSIPASGDVSASSGKYLWDAYREVLEGAVIAEVPTSDADETRIQAARTLLGPPNKPTSQYQAYLDYRGKCSTLEQSLHQAQQMLANSSDPTVSAQAKADCDKFQEQLDFCTQDWIVSGFKKEVDAAINTLTELSNSGPLHQWKSWDDDFRLNGQQNDSNGAFWPTNYQPDRLFDKGLGWGDFILTDTEVTSLSESASSEVLSAQTLGDLFSWGSPIELISMNIVRVNIERPWFHPELFYSRFWKWKNPDLPPLSNGEHPWPKGTLPGFITGLVLIREIKISLKQGIPNAPEEFITPEEFTRRTQREPIDWIRDIGEYSGITSYIAPDVYLVAYIVHPLPKSPDPDPTLKWG
ncbi:hypothetical protein ACFTQL_23790 [Peribacillus butanolivorans]|uniref:hypothetical protein n=1 Tax=Peribacillus butanolivorans TaxID=421767 RepID=UPI003626B2BD